MNPTDRMHSSKELSALVNSCSSNKSLVEEVQEDFIFSSPVSSLSRSLSAKFTLNPDDRHAMETSKSSYNEYFICLVYCSRANTVIETDVVKTDEGMTPLKRFKPLKTFHLAEEDLELEFFHSHKSNSKMNGPYFDYLTRNKENSENLSSTTSNLLSVSKTYRWHNFVKKTSRPHSPSPAVAEASVPKRTNSVENLIGNSLLSHKENVNNVNLFSDSNSVALRRVFSSHVSHSDFVQKAPIQIPSCVSLETGERLQLPHFKSSHDAIKRIDAQTMTELIDGKYSSIIERFVIIDCRFDYEYEGGHIVSAVNINSISQIENFLMESLHSFTGNKIESVKTAIVFHCEYSSFRAPRMALYVRKMDRNINASNYPALVFPEMYILDGGYKGFFSQFPSYCSPEKYIEMEHELYKKESARLLNQFKSAFSETRRSKTFSSFSLLESITMNRISASSVSVFSSDMSSDDLQSFEELCEATNSKSPHHKNLFDSSENDIFC